ncbi:MAG: signal recognition particle-docking protein FtsY [Acidimicrobiales bacterium]
MIWIIVAVVAAFIIFGGGLFFLKGRSTGTPPLQGTPQVPETATQGGTAVLDVPKVDVPDDVAEIEAEAAPVKPTFRDRLTKARSAFTDYLTSIVGRSVDAQTWEELEEALIRADVGVATSQDVLEAVRTKAADDKVTEGAEVLEILRSELKGRLSGFDRALTLADTAPSVWLFVGVNGVGKTTTIGKLAKRESVAGLTVVLGAGDTFRAAAAEQLEMWADRAGTAIVRGAEGSDPSAVIFDAVASAAAKGADLVMADTAGRLHNKSNLMDELRKVRRVAEKGEGTVSEVLLVLDATTGQNGLTQAAQFTEAVEVTGIVLTKLDGSAKGGIVIAIHQELGIPVKLVGLGEGVDDLVDFNPDEFIDALLAL